MQYMQDPIYGFAYVNRSIAAYWSVYRLRRLENTWLLRWATERRVKTRKRTSWESKRDDRTPVCI